MFKKLSKWLEEHGILWAWDEKQGRVHIWAIFVTIALAMIWNCRNLNWAFLWQGLAGLVTFGLPALAGIIAIIKKESWNPWYWFPAAMGVVVGGIISIVMVLICKGVSG